MPKIWLNPGKTFEQPGLGIFEASKLNVLEQQYGLVF